MRKEGFNKRLAVAIFIICFLPLYVSFSNAAGITDTFDSASINNRLWQPFSDPVTTVVQQNGELKIHLSSANGAPELDAGIQSKFILKGNFEVTVDYRLITWPDANGVRLGFEGPGTLPNRPAEFMLKRCSRDAIFIIYGQRNHFGIYSAVILDLMLHSDWSAPNRIKTSTL